MIFGEINQWFGLNSWFINFRQDYEYVGKQEFFSWFVDDFEIEGVCVVGFLC